MLLAANGRKKAQIGIWERFIRGHRETRGKVLDSAVENPSPRTSLRQHEAISISRPIGLARNDNPRSTQWVMLSGVKCRNSKR
jgi:hypothetical protein